MRRIVLGIAFVLLLGACGDSGTSAGPAPSVPAGCTQIESPKVLGAGHIMVGTQATYNTTPPSSGKHYPSPAPVGLYTAPIQDERQVHNLEHGHVMVQYRGISKDQIDQLEELVKKDPKKVVLAPYPDMNAAVALTAWGKIQTCDAWTDAVPILATYFIRANRDNAPESID